VHAPSTRWARVLLLVVGALLLSACAAGPNPEVGVPAADGVVAGFWLGLWHGIIAPITFVISLFTDQVNVYAVNNSGNWYDAGFMLGLTLSLGGGGASSRR
jgi:hypothetical protein